MARNPEDIARAGVEKAIKSLDKASEKRAALQDKYDEAVAAEKRAQRELNWTASHPDLPDDFDLDEFRRSLEAPFEDGEEKADAVGDAIESGAVDPDALEEPEPDIPSVNEDGDVASTDATISAADEGDDDPWGDE